MSLSVGGGNRSDGRNPARKKSISINPKMGAKIVAIPGACAPIYIDGIVHHFPACVDLRSGQIMAFDRQIPTLYEVESESNLIRPPEPAVF
jgi:hypothetical protein